MASNVKTGLLLVNTGTPDSPDPKDVRAYLKQFLGNKRIVPVNPVVWFFVLRLFILPHRGMTSGRKYETIWTEKGSPFILDHAALCEKLTRSFAEEGANVVADFAMSFGNPSVESRMRALREAGCEKLVVMPFYPQHAFSQASIVRDDVEACQAKTGWTGKWSFVEDYSANPVYLQAIADSVLAAGFDPTGTDRLLMSFHSIPCVDVENGDTYKETVDATCAAVAKLLGLEEGRWARGFQCRFDKEREWLTPFTQNVLSGWAEEGFSGRLFMVCPNFAVDCLETYYDIGHQFKPHWQDEVRRNGGDDDDPNRFVYVPTLGSTDAHVQVVRSVVGPYL